jgi:hypothetical protein
MLDGCNAEHFPVFNDGIRIEIVGIEALFQLLHGDFTRHRFDVRGHVIGGSLFKKAMQSSLLSKFNRHTFLLSSSHRPLSG